MTRAKISAIINILLLIAFIPCVYSAFVLHILIGKGIVDGNTHMGLKTVIWYNMHVWTGWIFVALCFVHVILHIRVLLATPRIFKKK